MMNQVEREFDIIWKNQGVIIDIVELAAKSRGMDLEIFKDQPKDDQWNNIRRTKSHLSLIYRKAHKKGGVIIAIKEGKFVIGAIRLGKEDEVKFKDWFFQKQELLSEALKRLSKYLENALKEGIDIKKIKSFTPLLVEPPKNNPETPNAKDKTA